SSVCPAIRCMPASLTSGFWLWVCAIRPDGPSHSPAWRTLTRKSRSAAVSGASLAGAAVSGGWALALGGTSGMAAAGLVISTGAKPAGSRKSNADSTVRRRGRRHRVRVAVIVVRPSVSRVAVRSTGGYGDHRTRVQLQSATIAHAARGDDRLGTRYGPGSTGVPPPP